MDRRQAHGTLAQRHPDLALARPPTCFRRQGGPHSTGDRELDLDKFDYVDHDDGQGRGRRLRRRPLPVGPTSAAQPRGARIVQRSANYTRPLVRRGMPYGPPYDPARPDDGHRRGLLGNFMCASLIAQYEAVMYDWINLGLQDPARHRHQRPDHRGQPAGDEPVRDPTARRRADRAHRVSPIHRDGRLDLPLLSVGHRPALSGRRRADRLTR